MTLARSVDLTKDIQNALREFRKPEADAAMIALPPDDEYAELRSIIEQEFPQATIEVDGKYVMIWKNKGTRRPWSVMIYRELPELAEVLEETVSRCARATAEVLSQKNTSMGGDKDFRSPIRRQQ